jgi:hypothetical protein
MITRMNRIEQDLFEKAHFQYGIITPCSGKNFRECFTRQEDHVFFWFNDRRGNTHCIIQREKVLA